MICPATPAPPLQVRKDQSLKLKEEYHAFRTRSAYTMFVMALGLKWAFRRDRAVAAASAGEVEFVPIAIVSPFRRGTGLWRLGRERAVDSVAGLIPATGAMANQIFVSLIQLFLRGGIQILLCWLLLRTICTLCPPALTFPFFPIPSLQVGIQILLCWLLYFYTAAALRESVLRMNGSHIRPWCALFTLG